MGIFDFRSSDAKERGFYRWTDSALDFWLAPFRLAEQIVRGLASLLGLAVVALVLAFANMLVNAYDYWSSSQHRATTWSFIGDALDAGAPYGLLLVLIIAATFMVGKLIRKRRSAKNDLEEGQRI